MKHLYQTKVNVHGGRDGKVQSDDGNLQLELSIPRVLGGPGKQGATNPEQLFAAGYAACFESAIRHVARAKKTAIPNLSVEAEVGLISVETGFALTVGLSVRFSGLEQPLCEELVSAAHTTCPYSNAVKNNINVKIQTFAE
jgi:Ohr subfamily peroxiredoxin